MDRRLLARGPKKGVSFGIPAASWPGRWLPPCFSSCPPPKIFHLFFIVCSAPSSTSWEASFEEFVISCRSPLPLQGLRKEELKGLEGVNRMFLRMKGVGRLKLGQDRK
ncbi:hypothetical protein AVEN_179578-1 [Araneus ventricosus]|uniref:Uncharacterized protein n=1 Tax=Araneus ventricosus TaxID=182803 RepID=A0A4Y2BEJ0_ARAVE|nr:hypothetical protein AVEN_179578-1 [Araneus ventricosus]